MAFCCLFSLVIDFEVTFRCWLELLFSSMLLDFTKVESPGARTLYIIIEVNFIKIKVNITMVGIIYSYIE